MSRFLICVILICTLTGCAKTPGGAALKKGVRALENGKYAESVILLQRSLPHITAHDERAVVLNCLGIAYHKLGRQQDAMQAFEESSAANPNAIEPAYNLGISFLENGDEDKAIACFEKASILNEQACPPVSDSGLGRPGSPARDTRALEFLAAVYCRKQQWDNARRILNEADRKTAQQSPRILTVRALMELQAGNTNQASEFLQKALEQDARYAPAIYNLGMISRQDQALPLLAEYIRLKPSGPYSDHARSTIKEIKLSLSPPQKEKTKPAEPKERTSPAAKAATTEKTAAGQPAVFPSFEELMQVAKKLEQQGRREAAFNNYLRIALAAERENKANIQNQALRHAASLADGNPRAGYDLGLYYLERNRKDDAVIYLKTARNQDADKYISNMAMAKLSLEKGDYDAAIVSLKKADTIRPDDPTALWLLADLYDQQLGLTNAAAQTYEQFSKRFANDRRATDAISRLKVLDPEFKAPENAANDKPPKRRSFWQRMYKNRTQTNK